MPLSLIRSPNLKHNIPPISSDFVFVLLHTEEEKINFARLSCEFESNPQNKVGPKRCTKIKKSYCNRTVVIVSERQFFLFTQNIYIFVTELTLIWEASVSPAYCWLQFRYSYLCVRVCVCCCGLGEPAVNPLSNMVERLPHLFLFHKTEQRSLLSLVDHGGGIKAALVYCRLSSSTFKIVVIILYSSRLRLWKKKSS